MGCSLFAGWHMPAEISLRFLRSLVGIAVAVIGTALFAVLFAVWGLRTDEIVDVERDTGNVATIFADQISQAVGAFDAALIEITERLAAIHRMTPEQYPEVIRSENLFHL